MTRMCKSVQRFSPFFKQCFVTCAVCFNIVGQGCAAGFPAVLLPQLQLGPIPTSKEQESWIASVMALSILLGNFLAPALMGLMGRKAAAYAVIGTALLGWGVLAAAHNVATLIIGRIIQGISYGIIMPLRPVLIGEYASPRYRGSFLTTISLSQTIGIGVVHFIGSLVRWQYTAVICCVFPLLSLLMTLYSPESPSYLAVRGRYEECRDAFHWLRGDKEDDELEKMIQARIVVQEEHENAEKVSKLTQIMLVARKKEVYKPVVLAMHVYLLAQFSGSVTLPSYAPAIIGVMTDGENDNFWMIQLDVLRFLVNVVAVFVIAQVQRRTMMFTACALCVSSHVAIAGYVYGKLHGILTYDSTWIPILLLNLQMASIGFGMVPMANVITGEIFPLQYRSILGTVSVIMVAASMFIILKSFTGLVLSIGLHGTYAIYGLILTYGVVVTWFLLPETKGRTLQEIEEHFRGRPIVSGERETEPLRVGRKTDEENKL